MWGTGMKDGEEREQRKEVGKRLKLLVIKKNKQVCDDD